MKIWIRNGYVISMDEKKEIITQEDIVIENDIILFIGKNYKGSYDKIIDAKDRYVLPGLINCHTHLGMSIFKGTNDNYPLDKWLKEYIWPIEDQLTDEDMYDTTLLSIIEMIKTGTTCFNDMYYNWKGSMKAFSETGIRGVYGRCLIGEKEEWDKREKDFEELYQSNKNDLIKLSIGIHSLYTTNIDSLIKGEHLATKYHLPIHIHLSENKEEVKTIKNRYQMEPIQVLEKYGLLKHKMVIAHGTFLSKKEINLIKGKDISICTNPISNLNLGCGISDISSYRKEGINVCLGTDGVGSGNTLNLFYHMSMVDNLQKGIYQDPTIMSSYEVLKMATINGAKALGLENFIGSLEVGKNADIIILDIDEIDKCTTTNPIIQIVHNGWNNYVDTTIVNGKIVMEKKELKMNIDIHKLQNKMKEIQERLK